MDVKDLFISEEAFLAFALGVTITFFIPSLFIIIEFLFDLIRMKLGLPNWRYVSWVKEESKLPPKAE